MKEEIYDIGGVVVCDLCNTDYTFSDESGGWVFCSTAYCPKCATPEALKKIQGYGEEKYIRGFCPKGMSFRDWILKDVRQGNNKVIIRSSNDFNELLNGKA